ncbi:hypothetical protein ACFQAS_06415 [Halopenitus salinus]|uniref:Uncharacterized protein n=1 Tax=Halopenitus salinus TaxID=1198295 RepID=A0ABD5UYB5_9EURY
MERRQIAPRIGALASVITAVVAAAPFVLVDGNTQLLAAYYGSGPVGLTAVVAFTLVGAVGFASGERGNVDPEAMAGGLVVLGVVVVGLVGLWWASIDETVLYSFPSGYRWIEWHPVAVFIAAIAVLVAAGVYARSVLE